MLILTSFYVPVTGNSHPFYSPIKYLTGKERFLEIYFVYVASIDIHKIKKNFKSHIKGIIEKVPTEYNYFIIYNYFVLLVLLIQMTIGRNKVVSWANKCSSVVEVSGHSYCRILGSSLSTMKNTRKQQYDAKSHLYWSEVFCYSKQFLK